MWQCKFRSDNYRVRETTDAYHIQEVKMKSVTTTAALWRAAYLLLLAEMAVCPLKAQVDAMEADHGRGRHEKHSVLYEGPLVHDQHWVLTHGTTNTQLLGVFGGTCSMVPSNVRNDSAIERVRFEAEHQDFNVWKMAWVDTVEGNAVAGGRQRYRYTYHIRHSFTGITTDGKAPNPSREMPTATTSGFLEVVPGNVIAAALEFQDIFLLIDEATGQLVADAQVLGQLHLRTDPSEQPPAFFPFVLDGYIANGVQTLAGEAGCDPL
jgi:hypothetical protein